MSAINVQTTSGIEIRVKGKVQGVGFRPYVWQIAHRLGAKGSVLNDGAGVLVRLWPASAEADFISALYAECPPLAQIDALACQPYHWAQSPDDFVIEHSGSGAMDTHIVPDAATCEPCRQELFDPKNRRYGYPFINCTHCGPRFTIIRQMPYDRPYTSMAAFPLCPDCQQEYQHPADRRFHAQPNACPVCGPQVWLCDSTGTRASGRDAIAQAAAALGDGQIVALKAIGGFHLACDASSEQAVARLRARKRRPSKPLAVMLHQAEALARYSTVADTQAALRLLQSPAAPIVLLALRPDSGLADAIAPGLDEVGFMLPANPLQHLLLAATGRPLVMTSGNANGQPPALDNGEALTTLAGIADLWLMHDRDIVQRADDSVVRLDDGHASVIRRARGYVPDALPLPPGFDDVPALLAMGADLKNTFCLLRGQSAILSQHLGDLTEERVMQQYQQAQALFTDIYRFTPQAIVVDAHPGYLSHQLGQQLAQQQAIPCISVLHHHAHIVACLAEHQWPRDGGAVIGLALDGIGYGGESRWWGAECLRVDYARCQYLGGLPAVALPGGDMAARQPWRNLLAQWQAFVPHWQQYDEARVIPTAAITLLTQAITRGLNAPLASSAGRLFDAVAAACGFAGEQSWEGEAACWLEALARQHPVQDATTAAFPVTMPLRGQHLDLATFWQQWLAYTASPAARALAFHVALADGLAELVRQAARAHQLNTVVCCGGVMHNRLLVRLLRQRLAGMQFLLPERLPAGDGGLSLGQALIAASQWPHG